MLRRSGVLSGSLILLAAGVILIAMQSGAATKPSCFQEGPFPTTVAPSENSDSVTQGFSWWPIGRVCEWHDPTHSELTQSGSVTLTALSYGAIAAGFIGPGYFANMRRPRSKVIR
jgi:hypothetical protein